MKDTATSIALLKKLDANVASYLALGGQFVQMLERLATNKDVDVSKISSLLGVQERMMTKQANIEANQAFARVCKAMPRIKTHRLIDFGKG